MMLQMQHTSNQHKLDLNNNKNNIKITSHRHNYCVWNIFCRYLFSQISRFKKILHRKQIIYMVHTLFLTDLRNFILEKYILYTVLLEIRGTYDVWPHHK